MGNMNICPVASDTRRYYESISQAEDEENWRNKTKTGMIDNAERGYSTAWLEHSDNWQFGEKVAGVLSDDEDDKLGRIRDLRRLMMDAWAECEVIKEMAK